ncbi:hypothetical protein [Leptospira interrogans]|uniref:Uncharacterized protein n=2 Tax=Leptospira interrogans TaxID=173 RepID=A0AAP9WFW4_LEPIR|nr:hypothetical protein [Leptospira interrogans]QCO34091.1 hypothetical protein E4414_14185 [Leptospira interrogans]QOI44950.1 hypothetical protein Lepto782_22340 [Leptospira interrogans serovar Canicola]QOI45225.1 hypothetical protein Lepto782_23940 [Leptospira interrogans serovar Canicola]QOI50429.1 hypothetical protein Lepto1489_08230 [Leptospira interrogans serovar Bataviae]UMQ55200.1 hypothetical protein FH582_06790 [Leptospira interrogans]
MKLKELYSIKLSIWYLLITLLMFLNNCLGNNIFGPTITNCEVVLDFIAVDLDLNSRRVPTEEQIFNTNIEIAYYAAHCDGTESKKHKRRKKEDPIYNISNKDDRY